MSCRARRDNPSHERLSGTTTPSPTNSDISSIHWVISDDSDDNFRVKNSDSKPSPLASGKKRGSVCSCQSTETQFSLYSDKSSGHLCCKYCGKELLVNYQSSFSFTKKTRCYTYLFFHKITRNFNVQPLK